MDRTCHRVLRAIVKPEYSCARILEKPNRLQMSQVFQYLCITVKWPAFQGFYKRDRGINGIGFPHQLYMYAQTETQGGRLHVVIAEPLTNFGPAKARPL